MSRSLMAFSALLILLGGTPLLGAAMPAPPRAADAGSAGWEPTAKFEPAASPFLLAAGRGVVWAGSYTSNDYGTSWVATRHDGIDHQLLDDIGIDPRDPRHVWVIDNVGSIFETRDGGATYSRIIDPQRGSGFRYSSVYAIAAAPSDPNVVFAVKNGFGVFRSSDAGRTWTFLPRSEVDSSNSIAVDPTSADIIYSGYTRKPFQKSAMVRQSTDRGESWRTALEIKDAVAITSIAVDPKNSSNVYAGSTGSEGALWVSRDRGSNFERLASGFDFTSVHRLATSPSEPAVAYAGVLGGGVWRTADRGRSWTRLSTPTDSVSAILIDPRNSQVLYLGDRNTTIVWRSTDGGTTWTQYFDAGSSFYRIQSAELAPSDPDVMYVSVFGRIGPMAGTLFRIEHGAAAPTASQPLRPCTAIAVDPRDDHVVYAVLHGSGVSRSRDGGTTWQSLVQLGSGLPTSTAFGFNGIAIDAASPDTIELFGGCDVGFDFFHTGANPADMHAIYRSTNAGTSWTHVGSGSFGSATGPVKGVVRVPGRPGLMLAETAAGLRVSSDSGASWSAPAGGVSVVQAAGLAMSSDGVTVYVPTLGGGVRTGTISSNGTITWDGASTLHTAISNVQLLVHPTDSKTLFATAFPGGIFKSTDGGTSWSEQNFGMASMNLDDPPRQGFYTLAIAPSNPQRMYVALYGWGVYTSVDGSGIWRPCNGAAAEMRGKAITSLLVDPTNDKKVWVAAEDGIRMTTNAGTTWTDVSTGLASTDIRVLVRAADGRMYAGSKGYEAWALDANASSWQQLPALANFGATWPIWNDRPLYQFTSPLFHPTDSKIVYLGTFPSGIFRSDDGGATWRERNIGSTNDGLFSLAFRPNQPDVLFAGTYNGVNRSTDGGEHWKAADTGWPAEQWVYSIDFDPRNPDVMYACSKNGENEGRGREDFNGTVMKSTDGGAKWTAITKGLDLSQSFFEIIVDRRQPDTIYLASERDGVLISRDAGASWSAFNEGLTSLQSMTNGNFVTSPMVLSSDGYYLFFAAGGAGGGVFRRAVATGPPRRRVMRP